MEALKREGLGWVELEWVPFEPNDCKGKVAAYKSKNIFCILEELISRLNIAWAKWVVHRYVPFGPCKSKVKVAL